jgi:hypothetical protein
MGHLRDGNDSCSEEKREEHECILASIHRCLRACSLSWTETPTWILHIFIKKKKGWPVDANLFCYFNIWYDLFI